MSVPVACPTCGSGCDPSIRRCWVCGTDRFASSVAAAAPKGAATPRARYHPQAAKEPRSTSRPHFELIGFGWLVVFGGILFVTLLAGAELAQEWPQMVWMGGVNGVDALEFGTPEDVRREVHRDIRETDALNRGGLFIASSSEINPPIPAENFKAMIDAVCELTNPSVVEIM